MSRVGTGRHGGGLRGGAGVRRSRRGVAFGRARVGPRGRSARGSRPVRGKPRDRLLELADRGLELAPLAAREAGDRDAALVHARRQLGLAVVVEALEQPLRAFAARGRARRARQHERAGRAGAQRRLEHRRVQPASALDRADLHAGQRGQARIGGGPVLAAREHDDFARREVARRERRALALHLHAAGPGRRSDAHRRARSRADAARDAAVGIDEREDLGAAARIRARDHRDRVEGAVLVAGGAARALVRVDPRRREHRSRLPPPPRHRREDERRERPQRRVSARSEVPRRRQPEVEDEVGRNVARDRQQVGRRRDRHPHRRRQHREHAEQRPGDRARRREHRPRDPRQVQPQHQRQPERQADVQEQVEEEERARDRRQPVERAAERHREQRQQVEQARQLHRDQLRLLVPDHDLARPAAQQHDADQHDAGQPRPHARAGEAAREEHLERMEGDRDQREVGRVGVQRAHPAAAGDLVLDARDRVVRRVDAVEQEQVESGHDEHAEADDRDGAALVQRVQARRPQAVRRVVDRRDDAVEHGHRPRPRRGSAWGWRGRGGLHRRRSRPAVQVGDGCRGVASWRTAGRQGWGSADPSGRDAACRRQGCTRPRWHGS